MKYKIILAILFIPFFTFAQERSIGLRLGEPLSITYKDFISDYISYEFMLGSAGLNGNSYYQRDFENNPPSNNAFYVAHSSKKGISLNARMAYNEDFTETFGIEQGYLLAYGGAGIQLRTANITYTYATGIVSQPGVPLLEEQRTNVDFGPEAFIGAEYYFDDLPINIFAEAGFFLELLDRVGHVKGQGAIGIRYIF
ncbi:hypothetical protein [Algoriphagus marinus]|uniref:hypothetical protein n=1 Tax=Algoriphagus marinus TaxID=1925762 RepID=UPI00094BA775|nr:hypothetical protein [Algoriphagus marinus]